MATTPPIDYRGDIHACKATRKHDGGEEPAASQALAILLYGSWNTRIASAIGNHHYGDDGHPPWVALVKDALHAYPLSDIKFKVASVKVDADDEATNICVNDAVGGGLGAPPDLPSLLFLGQGRRVEHVLFNGGELEALLTRPLRAVNSVAERNLCSSAGDALTRLFDCEGNVRPPQPKAIENRLDRSIDPKPNEPAIRLFIAGDRSQVGKSSICLGLLGALLNSGKYQPADLAYIKPATQCEQTQLVEQFCKHKGISACVPIGPIVYYKGFTRAFLKGEARETTEQMLQNAGAAVDALALNNKVVINDGVGYPAVGSITGTDNASVARACGRSVSDPELMGGAVRSPVPVLLIGKSGVGDAVDSFNINATYFTHRNVPVIGAIFNKLSLDGFYSLSSCKEAIDMYFGQYQPERMVFGFIPEIPSLKNARENVANASKEEQLRQALETAELFVDQFLKHVNVDRIIKATKEATAKYATEQAMGVIPAVSRLKRSAGDMESLSNVANNAKHARPATGSESKRDNSINDKGFSLTREQIEAMASAAGAAGGA